ncbi:hypothetical protein [uncultured Pseudacidovorax sp.]|uniref:hypothetical protein n=1 Tax=uncultured Pseudacidovorax sp. TaxID=679313 RepID=UPI0025F7B86C|nr:hypothetical protein [uncultured Pseudacidovorax sp.]
MDLLREKRRALGVHCPHKGGSSMAMATSETTNNQDNRVAAEGSVVLGAGANASVNMERADAAVLQTMSETLPDAVKAISQMGATTLRDLGGAVVDLNRDSLEQNRIAWDQTVQAGAAMVDKAIDSMAAGYGVASQAIAKFQPTDNANADIGKYAMLAAAAVAAAVLLSKGSK